MNKINFANPESLRSKYSLTGFTAPALLFIAMVSIQLIVVAYWYSRGMHVQAIQTKKLNQKHLDLIKDRFEAAAPFLNANKKTKLLSLHKQGIHPELITIDQHATVLTIVINGAQSLKKTVQSMEQLLDSPVYVTTMQDRNNRRYISLTTENTPGAYTSRQTS